MPRGVKRQKGSIAEQVASIDSQIELLKTQRKVLLEKQEREAVEQLLNAAKAAGKTPAELVAELAQSHTEPAV